jgi:lipoprotein Spr
MRSTQIFIIFCLLSILLGCTSVPSDRRASILRSSGGWFSRSEGSDDVQKALIAQYDNWEGTPYRFGGEDHNGIDCSAFVKVTFEDRFNIELPRSSSDQASIGQPVSFNSIQIGDLVFFHYKGRINHVGMYIGNGAFLHASTSNGVTLSRLSESYWKKRFWGARRVLASS